MGTGEFPASSFVKVSGRTRSSASWRHVLFGSERVWGLSLLHYHSFLTAVPTAELEPITETYVQADEVRCVLLRCITSRLTRPTLCRAVQKG